MLAEICRAVGFVGVGFILVAYFANQQRWLGSEDWRFPAANLLGSLLILVSLFVEWNTPSVVIELFWVAISLYGLINRPRRIATTAAIPGPAKPEPGTHEHSP